MFLTPAAMIILVQATPAAPAPAQPAPVAATKPPPEAATPAPANPPTAQVTGPKLVIVSKEKDLDFGKQPQDLKLVRPIRIKNSGTQTLNIESVSPG
jgi:hypothetical protein